MRFSRGGDALEQGRAESAVQTAAIHGGRDVKTAADFTLGAAVGGLGEVVQDFLGGRGGEVKVGWVQVVREESGG